jgi:hypothetical protein
MRKRFWRPLGFARLPDYAAERLGMHARSLQEDARVAGALESLPHIRRALETRALRWTHARLLSTVATPSSEVEWLRLALTSTTRRLAEIVKAARHGGVPIVEAESAVSGLPHGGESKRTNTCPDACASSDPEVSVSPGPDACALPSADACALPSADACVLPGADACVLPGADAYASPGAHAYASSDPDACASPAPVASAEPDDSAADLPRCWSIVATRAGRRLWRTVGDLASRMCGVDVPSSRVAEAVAAEAMSWAIWELPGEPLPRRDTRARATARNSEDRPALEASLHSVEPDPVLENLLLHLHESDAHEIDRRLRSVRARMQQIDAELGATLRKAVDHNVARRLGFADLRVYAEICLGICGSKAMALVRLDRECALRSPALLRAYQEGLVTWLAATTLLRVISRQHGDAWVTRAGQVTLRRLEAEVGWALDRADDVGGKAWQEPPPLDVDVMANALTRCDSAEIQMRAHAQSDLESFARRVDARIAMVLPESIATLLDDAIEGCRHAVEPRWRGFERILAHAWLTWMALPRDDQSVYARDSHRCQVPGCRSRGPLHAHHVWFRSKGGPDFHWNLTSVCEYHHRAIHRGEIRVHGRAPDGLVWELGCRPGHRPLLRLRGDVYWNE